MHFAAIGFFGSLFEAATTAIGTGIVVGGFAGVAAGMAYGRSRKQVEDNSLRMGFIGGVAACMAWLADLFLRYLLSA